jgi:NADH:ubiquinone oxidoreductase subunit
MHLQFHFKFLLFTIFLFTSEVLLAQAGNYYNSINSNSASFITDLKNRIRNPYTRISYDQFDETNIANFASFDNGNGTRSVFCVYSNYEYIYSGTFSWLPMSREHTYCFSWQPGNPSTSLDEYSDQYHLFPTEQDHANGIRANHPLGNVANVISTFLESKFGTDAFGNLVYEPRDQHKGDAARALLYMAVRYDGINGYDWSFNWLNNVRLPSLGEAPQNLSTLLEWHRQDPPDKWEVDRNNYVQTIQQNRNPFVDHPEYVHYINFNNLTKISPTFATEPENYVTNFTAVDTASVINFSWTDAIPGSQVPSGYLLMIYNRDTYFLPIDGEVFADDSDLSDGKAVINIPHSDADNYQLTGILANTTYYATIFSYNGSGSSTNYKINGVFPSVSILTTTGGGGGTSNDLFISEYIEGTSNNKAIEIYNGTASPIDLSANGYKLEFYFNGSSSVGTTINLSGVVNSEDVFILANSAADTAILNKADQINSSSFFSGDDAVLLKKGNTILDVLGQVGFDPGSEWGTGLTSTADNTLRRMQTITQGDTNSSDTFNPSVEWIGFATNTFDGLGYFLDPLPTELTSFSLTTLGSSIKLNWNTATEINNFGFEILRQAQDDKNWEKIGFVNGNGNSNSPKSYSFVDDKVSAGKYSYRLKQIDNDGQYEYSKTLEVDLNGVSKFELSQNYPNPFNPATTIKFNLPAAGNVRLTLFNILGQELRTLVNDFKEAGTHTLNFNAEDLNSGIYIYKIDAYGFTQKKKSRGSGNWAFLIL